MGTSRDLVQLRTWSSNGRYLNQLPKLIPRWNPHLWGTENRLWYTGGILPLIKGRSCDVVEPRSRNVYCTLALVQSVSVVAGLYPCTPLSLNERTDLAIHSPE